MTRRTDPQHDVEVVARGEATALLTGEHGRPPSKARAPAWRLPLVLGLVTFLVYLATASTGAQSMDVTSTELSAWHIAGTGLPWIDGVDLPERLEESPIRSIWVQETDDGHRVVVRSPGAVAAAVPAYWLLGGSAPGPGPAALTAALLSALTLVLLFAAVRTQVCDRLALAGTLVLGFTTPFWAVSADGMWPHTVANLGIAGMAWAASTRRWWVVGLFGAVALWGRLHAGIVVAVLGLMIGLGRRRLGVPVRIAVVGVTALTAMGAWTRWMYGSWSPRASYGATDLTNDGTMFSIVNELGVWVSPGRGLLVWTPLVLLLLPALVRSWRTLPDWSTALVQGGVAYTVVQGSMQVFTGGDSFYAYRYGLELVTAATPALIVSYQRAGPVARRLVLPVVALQLVAIAPGAAAPRAGDRGGPGLGRQRLRRPAGPRGTAGGGRRTPPGARGVAAPAQGRPVVPERPGRASPIGQNLRQPLRKTSRTP